MIRPGYSSIEGDKESTPIYQEFRVYIEGVQVPFSEISVSSVYGSLPTAQVVVPYLPYLQEIARNYRAKIHIFYMDGVNALSNYKQDREDEKAAIDKALKLLFAGEIVASNYSKSKSPFSSSSNLSFSCVHKNSAVSEMMMRTASFSAQEGSREANAAASQANAPATLTNPAMIATQIIQGIDTAKVFDLSEDVNSDPSGVPAQLAVTYKDNFKGLPGVLLRLWNIICTDAVKLSDINDIMQRLYIPLFTNLKFFEGITSHQSIETFLESRRAPIDSADLAKLGDAAKAGGAGPGTALSPIKASYDSLGAFAANIQISSLETLATSNVSTLGFLDFARRIMAEFFYEIITLNSPVQRVPAKINEALAKSVDEFQKLEALEGNLTAPGETIIKPIMPIYFSPKCNVLYPKMYSNISVNDMYAEAPTRVEVLMSQLGNVEIPLTLNFRSPPSLRDAFFQRAWPGISRDSIKSSLDTYTLVGNTVGITEIARGVKSRAVEAPQWMTIISAKEETGKTIEGFKEILTQYADYEYSIAITSTRTGTVGSIFNPYIIAGYPMDIVDPGLYRPSYHAFCTSVTHNISSSGVAETSIGFTNAITYDELYSVDTPLALPWLAEALGMKAQLPDSEAKSITYSKMTSLTEADQSIIDAANQYYMEVLGVGAAFPDVLTSYKYFAKDQKPPEVFKKQIEETVMTSSSPEESITLCRRPIQHKTNVEAVHAVRFIDTEVPEFQPPGALATRAAFHAPNGNSANISFSLTKNGKLANGFNAFLDYDAFEVKQETQPAPASTPASTTPSKQNSAPVTGGNSTGVNSNSFFAIKGSWVGPFNAFKSKYPRVAAAIEERELVLRTSFADYPQNLLKQIIFVESSYIPNAQGKFEGRVVAFGLGQLTYANFFKSNPQAFADNENGYIQNVKEASKYLARLKRSFSSFTWNDVAVAYNQGEGTVLKAKKKSGGVARYVDCRLDRGGDSYFNKVFDTSRPVVAANAPTTNTGS